MSKQIRTLASALGIVLIFGVRLASAQTTVVLDDPDSEVTDAYVRAGNYANRVYNTGGLITKANDAASWVRRTLLRFDTENFVPSGATIQSATLTLMLNWGETDTRTIGAYRLASAWDESAGTWYRRKSTGERWTTAGGDLGSRYAEAVVGAVPRTRVTFDLTRLVQETVNGTYTSRYTRVALVDTGSSSPS